MKYIEEYRDKSLSERLVARIRKAATGIYIFMEVCGGHTAAIRRFGIPSVIPGNIELISGPGCPVCVTPVSFIDKVIAYSAIKEVTVVTFGDLVRVPGSISSLEKEKLNGADIRIVFSGLEALKIAEANPGRIILFPGIGFETTAPGTAVTVKKAKEQGLKNFLLLSAHKLMPPVMEKLVSDGINVDGFICPGHVAAITGSGIFDFLPEKYRLGCVIAGFEPSDLLQSLLMLIMQVNKGSPAVEIQYRRVVTPEGNHIAQEIVSEVFEECEAEWRGFGIIPDSGLTLKREFEEYDAERKMPVFTDPHEENKACICGEILRGIKKPANCSLFGKSCNPENPVGACMVSPEGTCNSHYKYSAYE